MTGATLHTPLPNGEREGPSAKRWQGEGEQTPRESSARYRARPLTLALSPLGRGNQTDLPVLLPFESTNTAPPSHELSFTARVFTPKVAFGLALVFALSICLAEAQAQGATVSRDGVLATMAKWAPLIFQGFLFNILVSFMSMAIGTVAGTLLGLAQISLVRPVRRTSWYATQFFRNAPWLVLLF